jgi:cytochrome c biogenesis protein ResB
MDDRNVPAAVVEIRGNGAPEGTWLVSQWIGQRQAVPIGDREHEISMRWRREYNPFSITLLKATHEKYPGTQIPKDFRSRVRIDHPARNESREVEVYMNHPLRYEGLTFFQYQMAADEAVLQAGMVPSSTFQVMRNPSRLAPYLSCALVSLGLVVQFLSHLIPFLKRKVRQ